jgi:predicted amidohydrolase YtcJ
LDLTPDIVLINGHIFTAVGTTSFVQAVAITGERISATGTTEEISKQAGPSTQVIDLNGKVAVPGFNDAHTHFSPEWVGKTLEFKGMEPSWQEVFLAIRDAVDKEPPGKTIRGAIGAQAFFDRECTPTKLTEIAPNHPVILHTWTPHAAIMNSAMAKKLEVDEKEPPVLGGFFGKSMREGRWDGIVHEYAAMRLYPKLHDASTETECLRQMLSNCAKWGITSIQLMSLPTDPQHIMDLLSKIDVPIRVRIIPMPLTRQSEREEPMYPNIPKVVSHQVRVDGIKWLIDGTPVERSAAQRDSYVDEPGWNGPTIFSKSEVLDILEDAQARDVQLMVHVTGDRGAESILASMEETGGSAVWAGKRLRMEHGDGLMPNLIPIAKRLGVVVVVNPTHLTLGELFIQRFGSAFAKTYQPIRSLVNAGIPVVIGSDGEMNPFLNIMLVNLFPRRPQEALTREEAIIAYTATSAYAEFEESQKGTIEPGKLADIAVLSQDILRVPPMELQKTRSILTIVGGKIVYKALET